MRYVVVFVALCIVACSVVVQAQETTGTIIGTVTSQDGAPLPGVTMKLADLAKGFERTASPPTTCATRWLRCHPLLTNCTASLKGFQSVKRPIRVELGRTTTNDIEMQLGPVTATIEVTAEAHQDGRHVQRQRYDSERR